MPKQLRPPLQNTQSQTDFSFGGASLPHVEQFHRSPHTATASQTERPRQPTLLRGIPRTTVPPRPLRKKHLRYRYYGIEGSQTEKKMVVRQNKQFVGIYQRWQIRHVKTTGHRNIGPSKLSQYRMLGPWHSWANMYAVRIIPANMVLAVCWPYDSHRSKPRKTSPKVIRWNCWDPLVLLPCPFETRPRQSPRAVGPRGVLCMCVHDQEASVGI